MTLYTFSERRKDVKKIIMIALFIAAMLTLSIYAAPEANPTVRVGLYYGSNALPSANLQNIVGSGYRFGFFDSTHNFISQYSVSGTNKISMLKDKNLYYKDGTIYTSAQSGGSKLIGAYHIQLDAAYNTAQEASAKATSLNIQGIPAFVAVADNVYRVRVGSYGTQINAQSDAFKYTTIGASSPIGNSDKCVTVIDTTTGTILFEYDNGESLGVYPSLGEVSMPLTWFKGYKYHGGFRYIRDSGDISVVNFVPMQEYVKGVVPYEMSTSWPLEALKAQALCARTYALYNYGKHGKDFDVCNSTDCQVYGGMNSAGENSNKAVDETYGMYILYDGKPICAFFHSSDGGATEDSENVWSAALPYLRGVYDNNEDLDAATHGRWSYTYTADELTYILNAKGYSCGKVVNMYVKEFTPMGNVKTLTIVDVNGKQFNFSKEKARTILYSSTYKKYAHSQRYTVTRGGGSSPVVTPSLSTLFVNNSSNSLNFAYDTIFAVGSGGVSKLSNSPVTIITDTGKTTLSSNSSETSAPSQDTGSNTFTVSGTGWGHNVGMSQNGAKGLAKQGKTAEDIIHFYYTNVEIYKAR